MQASLPASSRDDGHQEQRAAGHRLGRSWRRIATKAVPVPLRSILIRGFRSAQNVTIEPGPLTPLIGEAGSGKSTWSSRSGSCLLPVLRLSSWRTRSPAFWRDLHRCKAQRSNGGQPRNVVGTPGRKERGSAVAALFFPALERAERFIAREADVPPGVSRALDESPSAALALIRTVEAWLNESLRGLVVTIEEPGLFLRPHAKRAATGLMRELALRGNRCSTRPTPEPSSTSRGSKNSFLSNRDGGHGSS